ncbi:MAG: hypothetical protein JWN46_3732 [Acidimicrobiales bacterium]|nr:hypothetical protein [Acidimicrobiales bacterium]
MPAQPSTAITATSQRPLRSRALRLSAAAAAAALALVDFSGTAHAGASDSRTGIDLLNWDRHIHGIPTIGISNRALVKAQRWANHIAITKVVEHSWGGTKMDPGGYGATWCAQGENVGHGPSLVAIETAFRNSAKHWANITDRRWQAAGVGVVHASDGYWEVQEFVKFRDQFGRC